MQIHGNWKAETLISKALGAERCTEQVWECIFESFGISEIETICRYNRPRALKILRANIGKWCSSGKQSLYTILSLIT